MGDMKSSKSWLDWEVSLLLISYENEGWGPYPGWSTCFNSYLCSESASDGSTEATVRYFVTLEDRLNSKENRSLWLNVLSILLHPYVDVLNNVCKWVVLSYPLRYSSRVSESSHIGVRSGKGYSVGEVDFVFEKGYRGRLDNVTLPRSIWCTTRYR